MQASTSGRGPERGGTATAATPLPLSFAILRRRVLNDLSSLPRAIALMAATFAFSALGTFIPQNKPFDYYIENYPNVGPKVLGFLSYDVLFACQLDHIYTAWYFYITLALLGASLAACTLTRQWPAVKVAQRWRFQNSANGVVKQAMDKGKAEVLPNAQLRDVGALLRDKGYQVFLQGTSLYAFKGLAGKVGPIGVHAAMLLILAGTAYSGVGGYKGSAMIAEGGQSFVSDYIRPVSPLATQPSAFDKVIQVNSFNIDYRPDGQVAQFYSNLSLLDPYSLTEEGNPTLMQKTISVNDPFRYGGITMYQTDWSLSSVRLQVLSSDSDSDSSMSSLSNEPITLPMASLEGRPGIQGRLWGSYLPIVALDQDQLDQGMAPPGISILARDPQSVVFYNTKGQFVGVRRPGSKKPIEVEGIKLVVEDIVGATGLEIKSDPGVPIVYAGFGGLMVTTLVSYLSHSQVWALQEGSYVFLAGRSNRARVGFEIELDSVMEAVPERQPAVADSA